MVLLLARRVDQLVHERGADSLAAMLAVHVDGMLDRVLVGRPRAECAVAGEPYQQIIGNSADHREASRVLRLEPADHALRRARLVVIERGRVGDRFVQDVEDRCRVLVVSARYDSRHA